MYLTEILEHKKREIDTAITRQFGDGFPVDLTGTRPLRDFKKAIKKDRITMIAEIKFRSPSKAALNERFSATELAETYAASGAHAISVIADSKFFGGSPEIVRQVARHPRITIPVMYKDFIVHPYQVYLARSMGADAVLLIARALDQKHLRRCIDLCRFLGMTPLVEIFDRKEIRRALNAGADIIGINNRNLQTFEVDFKSSLRLRRFIPGDITVVSESGIVSREEMMLLEEQGFSSVLVGESILQADSPGDKIRELLGTDAETPAKRSGYFGPYGGCFAAETLSFALSELEANFNLHTREKSFVDEFVSGCRSFIGRATPITHLKRLSTELGGAQIYAKREDLAHTGAHKINNAFGQGLLAKRSGKTRVVAETGAGQHGVAVASVCAKLGLSCTVYMGELDASRQRMNVLRMKLLGAEVREVKSGTRTLKDAVNEATRDWISNLSNTYYMIGSVVGPHPFPMVVRSFQSVIGKEAREQMLEATGKLPDCVVACVGGGSNAIGIFSAFLANPGVELIGVQAGGTGLESGKHSAPLLVGEVGIFQGARSYLLQDENGQILDTHSVAPGLDYAAAGPEHSYLKDQGRVRYEDVTDDQALAAFKLLSAKEGIIPALESSHAVAKACEVARNMRPEANLLLNISGRGDKDLATVLDLEAANSGAKV